MKRPSKLGTKLSIHKSQQGFALLTVLMIVALVAMIGSQLIYEQYTHIKRSSNMLHQAQSFSVAWGLESWVKEGLEKDAQNNQSDHLNELWADSFGPIPYEGGELTGQLIDLQGRLNLNNLLEADAAKLKHWQNIVQRYAEQQGLPIGFSDLVTDWVDQNDQALPLGAESNNYLLKQPAYSAANQAIVMLSELKQIEGLQRLPFKQWQVLQQDLTALPKVVLVNVNTAEPRVLEALAVWFTPAVTKRWLQQREKAPAKTRGEFRQFIVDETGFPLADVLKDLPDWVISVQTDYFLLQGQVDFGESQQTISAIFHRQTNKQVRLVQRWLSVTDTL